MTLTLGQAWQGLQRYWFNESLTLYLARVTQYNPLSGKAKYTTGTDVQQLDFQAYLTAALHSSKQAKTKRPHDQCKGLGLLGLVRVRVFGRLGHRLVFEVFGWFQTCDTAETSWLPGVGITVPWLSFVCSSSVPGVLLSQPEIGNQCLHFPNIFATTAATNSPKPGGGSA